MRTIFLSLIRAYQRFPHSGHCRFQPVCSEYAHQAIAKYGIFKGGFLSLKRIIRCQPFVRGGRDLLK